VPLFAGKKQGLNIFMPLKIGTKRDIFLIQFPILKVPPGK
jgi:hypothetical protein